MLSWCMLEIGLTHQQPGDLDRIRELIEVEYPLGNELHRSDVTIQFTFPELASETATGLLDALRSGVTRVVGRTIQPRVTLDRGRRWMSRETRDDTVAMPG